jgi:hypothetical protein
MQSILECFGQIRLGSLPWEISERLAQFRGNWFEFIPETSALTFRPAQWNGCPAFTGVPCELIALIDSIPPECREAMPGGELSLRDEGNRTLKLAVRQGEVHIRWPQQSGLQAAPVPYQNIVDAACTGNKRIEGWARFAGSSARSSEIGAFIDQLGGLYPEEDMPSECEQNMAYVCLKSADLDLRNLIAKLTELADPKESLQADLRVVSPEIEDQGYRIRIVDGCIKGTKNTV